jgi:hypothetical protein
MPKPEDTMSTIAVADGSDLTFGGNVTFDTEVGEKLKGKEYPMVYVECFQDDVKVWGRLREPDAVFKLGGDSSLWIANGGGPAACRAYLHAYGSHVPGGIRNLAGPVEFDATG